MPGTEASVAILGPVRALAAMLLLAAAPRWAPAAQVPAAATSLARLADAAAAELLRAAAGRAIALAPIEDRTSASPLASDLQALLAARLEGHVVAGSGTAIPRVDVTSVIAEAGPRLVWTGRLVDESGALVDVLSASAPWDADSLPLFRAHSGPDESAVTPVGREPGADANQVSVFDSLNDEYEEVVFFHDPPTGLRATQRPVASSRNELSSLGPIVKTLPLGTR